jgi:hypothetical protein
MYIFKRLSLSNALAPRQVCKKREKEIMFDCDCVKK